MRRGGLVALPGRLAPDSVGVFGILPEVLHHAFVSEARYGDAVGGLQYGQGLGLVLGEPWVFGELVDRGLVMRQHPLHRLGAIDFIEEGAGIGSVLGNGIGIVGDGFGDGGHLAPR